MATEKVFILCGEEGEERLIILSAKGKKTVVQASISRSDGKKDEIRRSNPTHVQRVFVIFQFCPQIGI